MLFCYFDIAMVGNSVLKTMFYINNDKIWQAVSCWCILSWWTLRINENSSKSIAHYKHRTPLMGLGDDRHIVHLGVIIDPTWSSHPINTSHSVPLIILFLLPDASKVKRVLEHFWNFEVATLTHSALRKSLIFIQINFPSFLHFYQFCTQIPSWSRSH